MEKKKPKRLTLNDEAKLEGCDLDEFQAIVNDLDERTKTATMRTDFVEFVHTINAVPKKNNEGQRIGELLSEKTIREYNELYEKIPLVQIKHEMIADDMWKECLKNTNLLMLSDPKCECGKELFLISQDAISSLCRVGKVDGPRFVNAKARMRNHMLAYAILSASAYNGKPCSMKTIYREQKEKLADGKETVYRKIFACRSATDGLHIMIPQSMIADIIKDMAANFDLKVVKWTVTNQVTEIYCEFPKMAEAKKNAYKIKNIEIVPGILFRTSDIGAASLCVRGSIRVNTGEPIFVNEISRKHCGHFDVELFASQIKNEVIEGIYEFLDQFFELKEYRYDQEIMKMALNSVRKNKKIPQKSRTALEKVSREKIVGISCKRRTMFDVCCVMFEASGDEEVKGTHAVTQLEISKSMAGVPEVIRKELAKKRKRKSI